MLTSSAARIQQLEDSLAKSRNSWTCYQKTELHNEKLSEQVLQLEVNIAQMSEEISTLSGIIAEQETAQVIREQEWIAKEIRHNSTINDITAQNSVSLRELESAKRRIESLESDGASQEMASGAGIKAAIYAKHIALEEKDKDIQNLQAALTEAQSIIAEAQAALAESQWVLAEQQSQAAQSTLQISAAQAPASALEPVGSCLSSDDAVRDLEAALANSQAALEIALSNEASARKTIARLRLQISESDLELVEKFKFVTSKEEALVTKVQAHIRGILGRFRVDRLKLSKFAAENGVLIALKPTVQGESGWYLSPDRSIYYFALKDGDWCQVCGPMSLDVWEDIVRQSSNGKNVAKMLSLFNHRVYVVGEGVEPKQIAIMNGNNELWHLEKI